MNEENLDVFVKMKNGSELFGKVHNEMKILSDRETTVGFFTGNDFIIIPLMNIDFVRFPNYAEIVDERV